MNEQQQHEQAAAQQAASGAAVRHAAPAVAVKRLPCVPVFDEQCETGKLPKGAERKPVAAFGTYAHFVPVSFVAKDWNVTPRRVRALLAAGRLHGQVQPNGYWEVRYPYIFTMGTRGPALKRQQRPAARSKKPELRAV